MERQTIDDSIRITWDYAWTAREALYGYRYFLTRGGQFLRQMKDCRIGFASYDEAEQFMATNAKGDECDGATNGATAPV